MTASSILDIATSVRACRAGGATVHDFTLGDFAAPGIRMPEPMRQGFLTALGADQTNYPPPDGLPELRRAIARLYERQFDLDPKGTLVLVQAGARPLLYAAFRALVRPGEVVLDPVPSWNNAAYSHLVQARRIPVITGAAGRFLPRATDLAPFIRQARLLVLSSPLNPAGTMYTCEELAEIADLVLDENRRRLDQGHGRPLYLLWDQVYWQLAFEQAHISPLALRPELARWTVLVDGASKAYACTGVRVGWCVAPAELRADMSQFLSHVGSWAPTPSQWALLNLLEDGGEASQYLAQLRRTLHERARALVRGLSALRDAGADLEVIEPQAGMYVAARLGPPGASDEALRVRLLAKGGVAVLPFSAFGSSADTGWFRFAVGAVGLPDIMRATAALAPALSVR